MEQPAPIPDPPSDDHPSSAGAESDAVQADRPPAPSTLATGPEPPAGVLASPEVRQFAAELATQLSQRWEVALQEQFRAELAVRLEAELKHQEITARTLQEEVEERRQWIENPHSKRNRHGPYGYATWQMERELTNRSVELVEMQRQMREMRERLRELGGEIGGATQIVDAVGEPPADGTPGAPETSSSRGG